MKYLRNYELMESAEKKYGTLYYREIVGMNYDVKIDVFNDRQTELILNILLTTVDKKSFYLMKAKFTDIENLNVRDAGVIHIDGGLIVKDLREENNGYTINSRYYVHDNSGYGLNDGYRFIEFYCSSLEILSIGEFEYREID